MGLPFRQIALMSSLVAMAAMATWITRSGALRVCRPTTFVKSVDIEGLVPRPLTQLCMESPWSLTRSDRELLKRIQMASERAHRLVKLTRHDEARAISVLVTYSEPEGWNISSDRLTVGRDLVESEQVLTEIFLAARFPPPLGGTKDHNLHARGFGQLYLGLLTAELHGQPLQPEAWSTLELPGSTQPDREIGTILARFLASEQLPHRRVRVAQRLWRQALLTDLAWRPILENPDWDSYHDKLRSLSEQVLGEPVDIEDEMRRAWQSSGVLFNLDDRFSPRSDGPWLKFSSPPMTRMEVWLRDRDPKLSDVAKSQADYVLITPRFLNTNLRSLRHHFKQRADLPRHLLSREERVTVWSPESARLAIRFGVPPNRKLPSEAHLLTSDSAELLGLSGFQQLSQPARRELAPAPIQPLLMMVGHAYVKD